MTYAPDQPEANRTRASTAVREWYAEHWGDPPETVYVVGLGRTLPDYMRWTMEREPPHELGAHVWTVNRGMHSIRHDCLFVMDDLPGEAAQWPEYGKALQGYDRPFVTSLEYPDEFPRAKAYPLVDMVAWWGGPTTAGYLHNSIPYLMALLPLLGVKRTILWGCDYVRPDGTLDEYGLANVEYWAGLLRLAGVEVGRPATSTVLGGQKPDGWIYGFRYNRLPAGMLEEMKGLCS